MKSNKLEWRWESSDSTLRMDFKGETYELRACIGFYGDNRLFSFQGTGTMMNLDVLDEKLRPKMNQVQSEKHGTARIRYHLKNYLKLMKAEARAAENTVKRELKRLPE